jgi:hypothetical protein
MLSLAVSACTATAPVAPSPTPARLVLLVQGGATRLDSVLQFNAYLADTDGAYANVTNTTQWSVSNPAILRLFGGNSFFVQNQGTVSILATNQGLAAVFPVTVAPQTFTSPVRLDPFFGAGDLNAIGHTKTLNATDQQRFVNVNNVATWTSADPAIATVSQGVVTAIGIGTTQITVAFGGGVDRCLVSVYPSKGPR